MAHSSDSRDFADFWGLPCIFQICAMLGVGILGWMAWELSSVGGFRQDIDVVRGDVASIQSSTASIQTYISDMRETIHRMDKRLTNVERDIGRIDENIANIMTILQRLDTARR